MTGRPTAKTREVYFIRAKGLRLIKIGVSDDSRSRLVQLQRGCPDELELLGVFVCDNYGALERKLHKQFARCRVRGEWFRPSGELLALTLAATWPEPRKRMKQINGSNEPIRYAPLPRTGTEGR